MATYNAIHLVARPGDTALGPELFEVRQHPLAAAGDGQILIRQTHMSLDPAMVGWMSDDRGSYIPPVELGDIMRSSGVGEVVESRHADFAAGDRVMGMFGWTEYTVSNGQGINRIDPGIEPEMALAVFGIPGLTATKGLFDCGEPRAGETLLVTGAAGSVGSIVGQLGKADGLRVIGVAGSEEKCHWLRDELGFDGVINYRADNLKQQLRELTPDGIDVFFENTGGPIQSLVFERMNAHGRIVVCGLIADYLAEKPTPGPSWLNVIRKRLRIQGFTLPDHLAETPALLAKLTPYVMAGKIHYRTHVLHGLTAAMDGLGLFFNGENRGKLIVQL